MMELIREFLSVQRTRFLTEEHFVTNESEGRLRAWMIGFDDRLGC